MGRSLAATAALVILGVAWILHPSASAPATSSDDAGDPSEDFPEDGEDEARGWALTNTVGGDGITEGGLMTKHWKFFSRMLGECGSRGLEACVGSKALAYVDGYLSQDSIPLSEGVALVRRNETEEEPVDARVSNGTEASGNLVQQLMQRASRFLRTYAVQLRLPETDKEEVAFGLDEGRKLKKTLLPIIMGVGLKVLGVVPLVFGGLALLVGKAVFVSKLAFVLAALVGLSSLMSGFRGGGGDSGIQRVRLPILSQVFAPAAQPAAVSAPQYAQGTQYSTAGVSWPSTGNSYGGGGAASSSGWSRRSTAGGEAQEMAYAEQIPKEYYQ